ncbi:SDR family NAD(P)-dependent oxidoreductase [Sporolactobacillus kofuensis]|uniref:SDR family NAD(P)-dependent oxidoreductase n=1 Tax=Sporolactobacillus kofuensis TaxID=269672 RepID=A0ABW1WDM2_9BACL|nr:SDR family oxidoreductase [Sporolactobacillus kofuensis]MCO7176663.1 SDR family oxidoreductase [Sporolactobacillus kofuensis]
MLKNRVVVITGASSGLGSELALLFAQKGAIVVLLARNEKRLTEIKQQINSEGGRAFSMTLDITKSEAVSDVFRKIEDQFGIIDICINCAGYGQFQRFTEMTDQSIEHMFKVNVLGLIACSKAALPLLLKGERKQLVNIASMAGKVTTPKSIVYGATKHAVIGFSDGLRMELENEGLRVLVVNPGPIRTPFLNIADPSGHYVESAGRFLLEPHHVAERVFNAIERNKRELNLPWYMAIGAKLFQITPGIFVKFFGAFLKMK